MGSITTRHCAVYRCLPDDWRGSFVSTSDSWRLTSFTDELPATSASIAMLTSYNVNYPFCCVHRNRDSQCFSVGQNCPFPLWDLDPHLHMVSFIHTSHPSKPHLDWFRRFCRARKRDQQKTHRQTQCRQTTLYSNRLHRTTAAMWYNNVKCLGWMFLRVLVDILWE